MKTTISTLILVLATQSFAETAPCPSSFQPLGGGEAILTSRYRQDVSGDEAYHQAGYSFRHLTHDVGVTRNNWEILFEARADFEDHFIVNTVTDDRSSIYDLGPGSCKPHLRSRFVYRAMVAMPSARSTEEPKALVKTDHCYLTVNRDSKGEISTLFHVSKHLKSVAVKIDEITVLEDYINPAYR